MALPQVATSPTNQAPSGYVYLPDDLLDPGLHHIVPLLTL